MDRIDWPKVALAISVGAVVLLCLAASYSMTSERVSQLDRRFTCGKDHVPIKADEQWVCIPGFRPGEKP